MSVFGYFAPRRVVCTSFVNSCVFYVDIICIRYWLSLQSPLQSTVHLYLKLDPGRMWRLKQHHNQSTAHLAGQQRCRRNAVVRTQVAHLDAIDRQVDGHHSRRPYANLADDAKLLQNAVLVQLADNYVRRALRLTVYLQQKSEMVVDDGLKVDRQLVADNVRSDDSTTLAIGQIGQPRKVDGVVVRPIHEVAYEAGVVPCYGFRVNEHAALFQIAHFEVVRQVWFGVHVDGHSDLAAEQLRDEQQVQRSAIQTGHCLRIHSSAVGQIYNFDSLNGAVRIDVHLQRRQTSNLGPEC